MAYLRCASCLDNSNHTVAGRALLPIWTLFRCQSAQEIVRYQFARSFNTAATELGSTKLMREGFISDFSHEFRTPINSLSGFAQLLREDNLSPKERREYLDIIVEESQRLTGLSKRILALSRIEHVEILPDVEPVAVDEQLRRAVVMLEPKWSAKGVRVNVSADPCVADGNADYLMQLWTNLLDNAIRFSPDGGSVDVQSSPGHRSVFEVRLPVRHDV